MLDELPDQQRNTVLDGANAVITLTDYRRKSFDLWMRVAKGIAVLCKITDRPGMSRKARRNLLKDNGYGTLNEGTIGRLLRMAEQESAIRLWRDNLTETKREAWNSPTSICNRSLAVSKDIAEASQHKPRRAAKHKDMLDIERALDVIGDHAYGLKDADQRAMIKERLLAFAKQFGKPGAHVDDANAPSLHWSPATEDELEGMYWWKAEAKGGAVLWVGPTSAGLFEVKIADDGIFKNAGRLYLDDAVKTLDQAKGAAAEFARENSWL